MIIPLPEGSRRYTNFNPKPKKVLGADAPILRRRFLGVYVELEARTSGKIVFSARRTCSWNISKTLSETFFENISKIFFENIFQNIFRNFLLKKVSENVCRKYFSKIFAFSKIIFQLFQKIFVFWALLPNIILCFLFFLFFCPVSMRD